MTYQFPGAPLEQGPLPGIPLRSSLGDRSTVAALRLPPTPLGGNVVVPPGPLLAQLLARAAELQTQVPPGAVIVLRGGSPTEIDDGWQQIGDLRPNGRNGDIWTLGGWVDLGDVRGAGAIVETGYGPVRIY